MSRPTRPTAASGRPPHRLQRRLTWLALALLATYSLALPLAYLNGSSTARAALPGRLVDAGATNDYAVNQPHAFPRDDLFVLHLAGGSFAAFYAYPPGFFGHAQGCRIRWLARPAFSPPLNGPEWSEGCGGAIWNPSGHKLFGPGPERPGGDLDRFLVELRFGHVIVDTRRLQCSGPPCERVEQPITQLFVTITNSGFQPARLHIAAGQPVFLILKNATSATQNWHLLHVPDAADDSDRWGAFTSPDDTGVFAAPTSDIHTPAARPGSQIGVPFMVAKPGAYTFQSDGDPTRLRGTLTAH